jgi:long-chain acyl-CoA synthetase
MAYQLVPLYDTLGPEAVPFIINQTEMKVIFVGKQQLPMLLKGLAQCPNVTTIVQFEDVEDAQKQDVLARGVQLKSLREIMQAGKKKPVDANPPLSSDIATICYTSGTTGNPKGAMLTHGNLMCAAIEAFYIVGIATSDVHMSFLPLPHVLERALQNVYIAAGASIGFYQGEASKLLDDLATLKPTSLVAVPRVFGRIHDRILAGVEKAGGYRKWLFERAYESKKRHLADGYLTNALWDNLVLATCVNSLAVAFA